MPSVDFIRGYENQPVTAQVESDRFCRGCGYNLRQQPIRIEPETQTAMLRCPECGRFDSAYDTLAAGHRWLHRLAGPAVVVWGLGLFAGLVGAGFALFIDLVVMYETLLRYDWQSAGYRRTLMVPVTVEDWVAYAIMVGVGAGSGLLVGLATAVCLPHWPRIATMVLALVWPTASFGVMYAILRVDPGSVSPGDVRGLLAWMVPAVVAAISGGVVMAVFGRTLGRGLVRVLLPGRLRSPLAYLWLVDGKTPPVVK